MSPFDRRTRDNPESCMVHAPAAPKADLMDAYYAKIERDKKTGNERACIDCKHMRLSAYIGPECHRKAFVYRDPITGQKRTDRVKDCSMERHNSKTNWEGEHVHCGYEGSWFELKE